MAASFESMGTAARAMLGLALLAAATAPALAGGCGADMACVAWDQSKGSCPDRAAALVSMRAQCSEHVVQEVQSDGELVDGDACCYEVRQVPGQQFCTDVSRATTGPGPGPGPSATSGSSSGGCSGIIGGDCGACVEPACCNELLTCTGSQACVSCFNDGNCAGDPTSAKQADQLVGCMAAAQCPGDACGANPPPPPLCSAPPDSPSGGKCVMLGGQVLCNPITNEGCNASIGEVCDRAPGGGFQCLVHAGTNAICNGCGASGWCDPGHTCYVTLCAKLCCDDSDCATGVCALTSQIPLSPPVGICVGG